MMNFQEQFKSDKCIQVSAPGRANLIGEHTDYNNGFVFPFPLKHTVNLSILQDDDNPVGKDAILTLASTMFPEEVTERKIFEEKKNHWTDYIIGSIQVVAKKYDLQIPSLKIIVDSNVPTGAGVSSSAALEVVTIRGIVKLLNLTDISDVDIAILARQAENEYVGMPCGIMDQFASSVGKQNYGVFLDCKTLDYVNVHLNEDYEWLVMKSGITHALVDGEYAKRVAQCASACKMLNVESLRDLTMKDLPRIEKLPELEQKRARHIVTENYRVISAVDALKNDDIQALSQLMLASHESQKVDYEITIPETDAMVKDAMKFGALSARQTGGGFGGSLIIILKKGTRDKWWSQMSKAHPTAELI